MQKGKSLKLQICISMAYYNSNNNNNKRKKKKNNNNCEQQ